MELGAGLWWASTGPLILFGLWRNEVQITPALSASAAVQYFDFPGGEPFVSELAAHLKLAEASLTLGKAPITWGDGLVHHDIWTGTEGAFLTWRNWELGAMRPRGEWVGYIRWRGFGFAAGEERAWAWGEVGGNSGKAELAVNSSREWAGVLEAKAGALGFGYLVFSEAWENLGGFPIIYDEFYNGWTGLGDATTWAAMRDSALASEVSSASGGDLGILWPDMRNLQAVNGNLTLGPARLDLFGFWLYDLTPVGVEASLNLVLRQGPLSGGLGAGYLASTGKLAKSQGVLRLWVQAQERLLP